MIKEKKNNCILKQNQSNESSPSSLNKLPSDNINLVSNLSNIKKDFDLTDNFKKNRRISFKINSKYEIDKINYIEERKGIVLIGLKSSGKTSFLYSLLGINCLVSNDNISTNFICIIRYNPKLNEPKFYHLKLKEENQKYYFLKDDLEIIGNDKIKEEIEKINKDNSLIKDLKFDSLFYMLETNITNIENKEFLLIHDFYDLPGMDEFISKEKIIDDKKSFKNKKFFAHSRINRFKKNKLNKELEYNEDIFKYIKNLISNQIIIFNTENYDSTQNIQLIKYIKRKLEIPFENSLIILNKIDKSSNPTKTIQDCKAFYINNLDSSEFNINYNIFIPLNCKEFQNEMLMNYNYENYFRFFYNKYCENKINNYNKYEMSFTEYLFKELTKYQKNKRNYIQELTSEFNNNDFEIIKKSL